MGKMLIFDYMYANDVCSHVEVNTETGEVKCTDYTDVLHRQAFGKRPHTIENVNFLFRKRCFPEQRPDKKQILEQLGLMQYNPIDIVRKTRGLQWGDESWIRFEDEKLTYEEVCNLII